MATDITYVSSFAARRAQVPEKAHRPSHCGPARGKAPWKAATTPVQLSAILKHNLAGQSGIDVEAESSGLDAPVLDTEWLNVPVLNTECRHDPDPDLRCSAAELAAARGLWLFERSTSDGRDVHPWSFSSCIASASTGRTISPRSKSSTGEHLPLPLKNTAAFGQNIIGGRVP